MPGGLLGNARRVAWQCQASIRLVQLPGTWIYRRTAKSLQVEAPIPRRRRDIGSAACGSRGASQVNRDGGRAIDALPRMP